MNIVEYRRSVKKELRNICEYKIRIIGYGDRFYILDPWECEADKNDIENIIKYLEENVKRFKIIEINYYGHTKIVFDLANANDYPRQFEEATIKFDTEIEELEKKLKEVKEKRRKEIEKIKKQEQTIKLQKLLEEKKEKQKLQEQKKQQKIEKLKKQLKELEGEIK